MRIIDTERENTMFKLSVDNLSWIDGDPDNPDDLCAHGHAVAYIGDEIFEYDATVSAGALYMLKSLSEDHIIHEDNQMLPCCGFAVYARRSEPDTVDICGCPNGIDWSVIHDGDMVRLITETGKETKLPIEEYRAAVFAFADTVEAFYRRSAPRIVPENETDREGYAAFWREWRRRRGSV